MMTLVLGASSSGKSALAESIAVRQRKKGLFYIAAMHIYDAEGERRVARHREMRAQKGFETIERYRDIGGLSPSGEDTLLLECMSNLLANEMYDQPEQADGAVQRILSGILLLREKALNLVVVSNEVFSDGEEYDPSCMEYIRNLGEINRQLALLADTVIESVAGIPIYHKGGPYADL